MLSGFSFNDAYRIIKNVVDERINALVRSGAGVDILWGTVAGIGTPPNTCSVYLPGETVPSTGFRLENGMKPNLLDPVRVAIDKRGNRWVEAVLNPTAGGFLDVRNNQVTGLTGGTIVAAETDGTPSATVSKLIFPPDTVSVNGGDATIRSVPQGFVGAKVYNNTTQASFGAGVEGVMVFNAEDYDTDGFHDTVTNNSRLTIPAGLGGKYLVRAFSYTGLQAQKHVRFRKNGSIWLRGENTIVDSSGTHNFVIEQLNAGDYLEAMWWDQGGNTFGHASAVEAMSTFEIVKLDSGNIGQGIGASVYNSAAQNITNITGTPVSHNTEAFDTDGFFAGSGTSFTIPAGLGGKYIITGTVRWADSASGLRELALIAGGNTIADVIVTSPGASAQNVSGIVQLNAGDTAYLNVYHSAGATLAINGGRNSCNFSIARLDSGSGKENIVNGALLIPQQPGSADEGGELQLAGAASYPQWNIDNFAGRVRMHSNSGVFFNLSVNGWQGFSYQNGWTAYGSGGTYGAVNGYFKDALGFIHLRGLISSGTVTVGTTMLNLPTGCRPPDRMLFLVLSNDVPIRIDIDTNGNVIQMSGSASNLWISLSGISFYAGGL